MSDQTGPRHRGPCVQVLHLVLPLTTCTVVARGRGTVDQPGYAAKLPSIEYQVVC